MDKEWKEKLTPIKGTSEETQIALDWWNELPVQNLINMNNSWVGYLWKYYPEKEHPYHLTEEEILFIYEQELL